MPHMVTDMLCMANHHQAVKGRKVRHCCGVRTSRPFPFPYPYHPASPSLAPLQSPFPNPQPHRLDTRGGLPSQVLEPDLICVPALATQASSFGCIHVCFGTSCCYVQPESDCLQAQPFWVILHCVSIHARPGCQSCLRRPQ